MDLFKVTVQQEPKGVRTQHGYKESKMMMIVTNDQTRTQTIDKVAALVLTNKNPLLPPLSRLCLTVQQIRT